MTSEEFWWIGQRAMDATTVSRVYPVKNVISCDYDANYSQYCSNHVSLEKATHHRKNWGNNHIPEILENEGLKNTVKSLFNSEHVVNIVPYSPSPSIRKFFRDLGANVRILSCEPELKAKLDSKFFLREILGEIGLNVVPGEEVTSETDFSYISDKYGLPFIVQEDISSAGRGTKLIHNKGEFSEALKSVQRKFVMKLLKNSRTYGLHCCITPDNYVFGPIGIQIVGDAALSNMSFCYSGNDYSQANHLAPELHDAIHSTVRRLAERLRKEGWKGIFNVDAVCSEDGEIYIVDLNPRLTGNIQFITDIQLIAGNESITKHHINAFIGVEGITEKHPQNPVWGSQLVLHNLEGCKVKVNKSVKPGVYELIEGELVFKREGISTFDCNSLEEFVVNCTVAEEGMILDPDASLLRVQSKYSYANPEGILNDVGKEVTRAVYNAFEFEKLS